MESPVKPGRFSFQKTGLIKDNASGESIKGAIDYSRKELPPLNEASLDEQIGLGLESAGYGTSYYDDTHGFDGFEDIAAASGPIDWNNSFTPLPLGIDSEPVTADINNDKSIGTLVGFDDWSNIEFRGGLIGFGGALDDDAAPVLPNETSLSEMTPEDAIQMSPNGKDRNTCPNGAGFWKSKANAWPVNSLALGKQTYTSVELRALLRQPIRGDASLILARSLIAAGLNFSNNTDPRPVLQAITEVINILNKYPGKFPYNIKPSSSEGLMMTEIAKVLEGYNEGELTQTCTQ